MQDKNYRYTPFQINLCYLFTPVEMVVIQHFLDIDYLKSRGYNTAWSKSFLLKKINIGEKPFDKTIKRLESISLVEVTEKKGSKTRYEFNRQLYLKLVRILNSTNNIDQLRIFCDENFISKNRSIEDVTEEEIKTLSLSKTSFGLNSKMETDPLQTTLNLETEADPETEPTNWELLCDNCDEPNCQLEGLYKLSEKLRQNIHLLKTQSCKKSLPDGATVTPNGCESDSQMEQDQLPNGVHKNTIRNKENNTVFPSGKNQPLSDSELKDVIKEFKEKFSEGEKYLILDLSKTFREILKEQLGSVHVIPDINISDIFPLFEYYGAKVLVKY